MDLLLCGGGRLCNCSLCVCVCVSATVTPQLLTCDGPGQFQCDNGWCVSVLASCTLPWCQSWNFRCDGYRDCADNSDEAGCTSQFVLSIIAGHLA